jgi:hypothetical protein
MTVWERSFSVYHLILSVHHLILAAMVRSLPLFILFLWLGLLSAAQGQSQEQSVLAPLTLTQEAIEAGGIQMQRLPAVRHAPTVAAFGQVLDPARLAALSAQTAEAKADIAAADARLKLAQNEAKRAAGLFRAQGNVSMAEYQSAQSAEQVATAGLAVTKVKLRSLEAGIRATWGRTLAAAIDTGDTPLADIEAGSACLVQVTVPFGGDLATAPPQATARPATGPALALRLVGPSPQSPGGNGPGFYYLGSGPACPPVGLPLRADMPSGPEVTGVVIPAAAVVWRAATPLVYRKSGKTAFTPVILSAADRTPDGYFVRDEAGAELKPGVSVVVAGSALLLSESQAAALGGTAAAVDDD